MRGLLAFLALGGLVVGIVCAVVQPDTVTMSGRVVASCATLGRYSGPTVSDEDGRALGGSAQMTTSATADGGCLGRFEVSGLPERVRYVAAMGSMSTPVPRGSVALVVLSDR
ncbi:hypothetical protein [Amycolatopsis kentuckyensis]|uniref:hypothetical protein n=1 Tax=Amycolatopsis kentuckyensis TaxID=218823 RepID=UPI00356759BD